MRLTAPLRATLTFAIAFRFRHELDKTSIDYAGLALAAFISWAGLPGPGEPVLIASGISAAHHHLGIGIVILVAFAAAAAGGIAGWLFGIRVGRRVLSTPRLPLKRLRRRTLRRGEQVFQRAPTTAILLTPAFIAGIHHVPSRVYQPVNAISAAVWAAGIGLGAYWVGPPVLDVVSDAGWVIGSLVAVLLLAAGAVELRRRRRGRRANSATDGYETSREPETDPPAARR